MKGLFIPEITAEMFKNGCLESIEALMTAGEIYDIEYQQWIPCSERLPFAEYGESETVFTTCKHREPLLGDGGYLWREQLYFNGSNWCHPTGEAFDDIVVAWMPLPEPYQEEKHE